MNFIKSAWFFTATNVDVAEDSETPNCMAWHFMCFRWKGVPYSIKPEPKALMEFPYSTSLSTLADILNTLHQNLTLAQLEVSFFPTGSHFGCRATVGALATRIEANSNIPAFRSRETWRWSPTLQNGHGISQTVFVLVIIWSPKIISETPKLYLDWKTLRPTGLELNDHPVWWSIPQHKWKVSSQRNKTLGVFYAF